MNLFQRIARLPLVVSSSAFQPLVNTGLLILGLTGVIRKNSQLNPLPINQPVVQSNPLKLFMYFIDIYKNLRDSSTENDLVWIVKNIGLVINNLVKMFFVDDSSRAVSELPHVLAGKIEAKHIVPNTGGQVFVLALSEGFLATLGFISYLMFRISLYLISIWLFNRLGVYIYNKIKNVFQSSEAKKETIDVFSKELKSIYNQDVKQEPVYLQKYLSNRNAE